MEIQPIVHRKGCKKRKGRGFSRNELKEVGLSLGIALKMGIPVDKMRRTKHVENVEALRHWLKTLKSSSIQGK